MLGFKGPRKMTVIIPGMNKNHQRVKITMSDNSNSLLGIYLIISCFSFQKVIFINYNISIFLKKNIFIECYRTKNMDDLIELHNKTPQWNEETQSYVLNFHGRVTQASVKNFQIVHDNDGKFDI